MKKIYLVRHAEAPREIGQLDIDRKLSDKGEDEARQLGEYINRNNISPDLILCSHAYRAAKTFEIVNSINPNLKNVFDYDYDIYDSSAEFLFNKIKSQNNEFDEIMLIGHNPTLTELVMTLDSAYSDDSELIFHMPPATLVGVNFEETDDWEGINAGKGATSVIFRV
jgi:phosphohistidine phosphatase